MFAGRSHGLLAVGPSDSWQVLGVAGREVLGFAVAKVLGIGVAGRQVLGIGVAGR